MFAAPKEEGVLALAQEGMAKEQPQEASLRLTGEGFWGGGGEVASRTGWLMV